jgi:heme exporter protein CcmD
VTTYLVTALVVLLLIAWIVNDFRNQRRRLRELEMSGAVRRSGRSATER